MATIKAGGYSRQAGSAQYGQAVKTRHVWDADIRAATDKVLIARLLAGHRIDPMNCELIFNGEQAAMDIDVCVGEDDNKLFEGEAALAATYGHSVSTAYQLEETLGIDYDADRDVYLLINSGAATAPEGGQVILKLAQIPG